MGATRTYGAFEWDAEKDAENLRKHGLRFRDAVAAFLDPHRVIAQDSLHSETESRMYCIGKIGRRVATVRFTTRDRRIRIIGAGYWRKGRQLYEETNAGR